MSVRSDKAFDLLCGIVPLRLLQGFLNFLHRRPQLTDRLGFHVRQIHYYEPLPDFSTITAEAATRQRRSPAVAWNLPAQQKWVENLSGFAPELAALRKAGRDGNGFDFNNTMFSALDAAVYYATVRTIKPKRIIEIGSGYSTQIACLALQKNRMESDAGEMTCIEPYPPPWLHGSGMAIEILAQGVETVDLDRFRNLKAGDILFIDSSHTVKFASDVLKEFLEILPELEPGVVVHVHDIFFPADYPPDWLRIERRAWNEQYLLEAFLAFNTGFEILVANHLLGVEDPGAFAALMDLPKDRCDFLYRTGSFWMRRKPSHP